MSKIIEQIDTVTVQFNNFHFFENGDKQIEEVKIIAIADTTWNNVSLIAARLTNDRMAIKSARLGKNE